MEKDQKESLDSITEKLIEKIKQKQELQGIDDSYIKGAIEKYLKKHNLSSEILKNLRGKEIKLFVKDIRAQLRLVAGQFTKITEKERASNYSKVREIINSLNPRSILDIGCGLNPLFLASPEIEYHALDINNSFLNKINSFFKEKEIKGSAFFCDIREIRPSVLPKADLCLILKVFDVIEKRGHKLAEKIIKNISCNFFLISFPTKTLSRKPMARPQRGWIERLLARLGFSFQFFKTKDEVFYLAEKINTQNTLAFS